VIGQQLSHYRIESKLGAGGMGEVYSAVDLKLNRTVALKLIPAELAADPIRLRRLEQEALSLASLNHPNIVTVHSVEEADGVRFLTMESVEGQTLDKLLESGPIEEDLLREIALQLSAALIAAHEKGVIHRDLKPANVMWTGDGRIKVLDFGLSSAAPTVDPQAQDPMATKTQALTSEGTILGTVPYMSPEQLRGQPADERSDLFSLGVMLYELATGQRPFQGVTVAETASAILRDVPAPTSSAVDLLIRRCLIKDPSERVQSAKQFRDELLQDEQQPAVAPRRRWALAIALILVLSAAGYWLFKLQGLLDASSIQAQNEEALRQKTMIVLPFESLGDTEHDYFVAGLTDELTSRLSSVASLGVISRTTANQFRKDERSIEEIGRELGVDYVLEGTVRWSGDNVRVTPRLIRVVDDLQLWSSPIDQTMDEIFAVQTRVAERVIRELDLNVLEPERRALMTMPTENVAAYQSYLKALEGAGAIYYSREAREQTIQHLEDAVRFDPEFALAWATLSDQQSYFFHLRYDTSQQRIDDAKFAVDRAIALDPNLPESRLALANYHYRCHRDYEQALAELSAVAAAIPNRSDILFAAAAIRRRLGDFERAAQDAERALALDPRNVTAWWDLGVTYFVMGQFDRAQECALRANDLDPANKVAIGLTALFHWFDDGDLVRARSSLETIEPYTTAFFDWLWLKQLIYERSFDDALAYADGVEWDRFDHTTLHRSTNHLLAQIHGYNKEQERSRSFAQAALRDIEAEIDVRPDDARIVVARGQIRALLGDCDAALVDAARALELYPTSLDAFHGPNIEDEAMRIFFPCDELERAFAMATALVEGKNHGGLSPSILRIDPFFDPWREDERFAALVD
jgi:serine/threonine-protein kinase